MFEAMKEYEQWRAMISPIKSQTYPYWELCLADGGSADKSVREAIKSAAKKDGRIKYTFLKENLGISLNTNAAIEMAKGSYIGFIDQDDILSPDAL